MEVFDVIICGGGPAGSTCALALVNSGLKVAVIEKGIFPRAKVCGDAVAAYVPKVLHAINPEYATALSAFKNKTTVNTCRVFVPNGNFIDIHSRENGFISKRIHLDEWLYKLSAAEPTIHWFLQHEIKDISINLEANEVTVKTFPDRTLKAKLVIGCDGAHSIANKILIQHKPSLKHQAASVRAYYDHVTGMTPGTYELHFLDGILPGYFWIFPLPGDAANVGLCMPSSLVSQKRINLRETMQDIILSKPVIRERFKNATLTGRIEGFVLPLATRKLTLSGDHFMLCGDAASLIDPLTGEGIGQSMISGRYAGWQAINCFKENNFSGTFMKQYDKQVYKKLWPDARKSNLIRQQIFKRKFLLNKLTNLLVRNKRIRNFVMDRIVKVSKSPRQ